MTTINERFAILRKTCKKNQEQWGTILGISRTGIADIEAGRRKVTNKHLVMLSHWEEYNINIDWLRTGEGDMFLPMETDTLESIRQEYHLTDPQFKFISNFLRLPENEKEVILKFLSSVFESNSKSIEDKIQEEVEAYRNELELEASRMEKSQVSDMQNVKEA